MTGNRAIVSEMVDALNEADVDRFVSYYADDVSVRMMGRDRRMQGSQAVREWIEDAFDALDGFCNDIVGIYGDGDVVVLEVIARGTSPSMPTRSTSTRSAAEGSTRSASTTELVSDRQTDRLA